MAADGLAPYVSRTSAAMVLIIIYKQVLIFHGEGFQLVMRLQCLNIIEDANKLSNFINKILHVNCSPFCCGYCSSQCKLGQYHGCWCPSPLCHQVISNHAINFAKEMGTYLPGGRISTELSFNPLRAKFFRENINIYLHFMSFLHSN